MKRIVNHVQIVQYVRIEVNDKMGGYSCEECLHRSCYVGFSDDPPNDDTDCKARVNGYPNIPKWVWNGQGPDPRGE
jgi:hypothetical protein